MSRCKQNSCSTLPVTTEFRNLQEITWAEGIDPVKRYVVCAANRYGEVIIAGARHHDSVMRGTVAAIGGGDWRTGFKILAGEDLNSPKEEQGFIDQYGVFMSREEAAYIVDVNKQVMEEHYEAKGCLISENLY